MYKGIKKNSKPWLARGLVGVWLAYASLAVAEPVVLEEEGVVKLVATLQNNPAFTNVVWRVYRLDDSHAPVQIIPRHTATLNLSPGSYRAVAYLNNKERGRSFQLKSNGAENIVISMD